MANAYTVRMPDGKEYGPADLEALQAWQREGRISADTLVWKQGDHDWRPLSQVIDTGEVKAVPAPAPTVAMPGPAAHPAPAPATEGSASGAAAPPIDVGGATVKASAPPRLRNAAPRTARRPRPSPLRILVPVLVLGALVAAAAYWWNRGQPERELRRAEANVRRYGMPDRSYADEGLGLRMDVPEGWIVLRPDNPLFHAPDARLRLAQPAHMTFARLFADASPRGKGSLDEALDRAVGNWQLLASGLREDGRMDVAVSGTPGRRALTAWTADGQELRGSVTVWKDAWNDFTLAVWGPGGDAEMKREADILTAQVKMSGAAMARVRAAADTIAPEAPELNRESVEALVLDRLSRNEPTADLPQTSLRAVSRGLPALSAEETQEMGRIYLQVYKPLKDKERAALAAWMERVRGGQRGVSDDDITMRAVLRDGILALPEDVRARLQLLNDKAIRAALGR
jgi:hypothetical protein